MADIQRWTSWCSDPKREDENGAWVTYADHAAAVAEAVRDYAEAHYANKMQRSEERYEQGQRDERERIRTGVTGLQLDNAGCVDYADLLAVIDAGRES